MRYCQIAGLDIPLSSIGLGGEQLGVYGWRQLSEPDLVRAVHQAVDSGITFFDTAPIYGLGHSEELLGRTLGVRRKNIIIATKVGLTWEKGKTFQKFTDSSPANINREIDVSLSKLNTDYIDLYQINWPDPDTPIEDTMAALEKLVKAGKIRGIGCCNFSPALLKEAMKYTKVMAVQIPYNLIDREVERDQLLLCRENGIAVIAYTPIAKGLLAGKYDSLTKFGPDDNRSRHKYFQGEEFRKNLAVVERVKHVARRLNRTPAQIAMRWVLENPGVTTALVGVKNTAQLEENVIAADITLSQADIKFLNESRVKGCY